MSGTISYHMADADNRAGGKCSRRASILRNRRRSKGVCRAGYREVQGQSVYSAKPQAIKSARSTSCQRDSFKVVMRAPKRLRWAREIWSKLRAHTTGIPSSLVSRTSLVSPRIVRVIGTTIISLSWSITSVRVSRRTGRRLSGARYAYQRISPLLNRNPPNRPHPNRADHHRRSRIQIH